jgi:phage/plasmid-like protein (TIGR03299 family)
MAHEVQSMFFAGETPWHGLGAKINPSTITSATAAMAAAGGDVGAEVTLRPLASPDGLASDHQLVVREAAQGPVVYGTVGPDYTPVQDRTMFDLAHGLVGRGLGSWETAGALFGGKVVWSLIRIAARGDADRVSADDRLSRFALCANSHDGSRAVTVGLTMIRVECANTLSYAQTADAGNLIRTRHTANVHDRIEIAARALPIALESGDRMVARYRAMRDLRITKRSALDAYLAAIFPGEKARQEKAAKTRGRSKLSTTIETLWLHGRGSDLPGVAGTAWGAYNAVTEYLTHVQGRGKDARKAAERRAENGQWGLAAEIARRAASDRVLNMLAGGGGEIVVDSPAQIAADLKASIGL